MREHYGNTQKHLALREGFLGSQRRVAPSNGKKSGQVRSSAKSKAARAK